MSLQIVGLNGSDWLSKPTDPFFDFCLWPYEPIGLNPALHIKGSTLLLTLCQRLGMAPEISELAHSIVDMVGEFQTVWGIKTDGERLGVEFYFYDYRLQNRIHDFEQVHRHLRPYFSADIQLSNDVPYFMYSIELPMDSAGAARSIDEVDFYVGIPGGSLTAGACYRQTAAAREFKNVYYFFDTQTDMPEIERKFEMSVLGGRNDLSLGDIFWAELNPATVVQAHKRTHESFYFSRVSSEGLRLFLARGLPEDNIVKKAVSEFGDQIDHLYFDAGYDYTVSSSGNVIVEKMSFYGLL